MNAIIHILLSPLYHNLTDLTQNIQFIYFWSISPFRVRDRRVILLILTSLARERVLMIKRYNSFIFFLVYYIFFIIKIPLDVLFNPFALLNWIMLIGLLRYFLHL